MLIEIGNALWKKDMRGEIARSGSRADKLALIGASVTVIDDEGIVPRALKIALSLEHAIHDCVYFALAERLGDRLVTADRKFASKAVAAGLGDRVVVLASIYMPGRDVVPTYRCLRWRSCGSSWARRTDILELPRDRTCRRDVTFRELRRRANRVAGGG